MKIKEEKALSAANDLVAGEIIKIAGSRFEVKKVENVFYYMPNAAVRITLHAVGATPRAGHAVLFLPTGFPVTVRM